MYDDFYGLKGRPFQLTPDPHFFFESATHRKALSYLGYGMAQGEGFIVITGDIGAGKTTLVGHVMATIDPARLTAANIVSTQVEGDDLLRPEAVDASALERDLSGAGFRQPRDRPQGGALPGAVRADEGDDVTVCQTDRDALQRRDFLVVHGQLGNLQKHRGYAVPR